MLQTPNRSERRWWHRLAFLWTSLSLCRSLSHPTYKSETAYSRLGGQCLRSLPFRGLSSQRCHRTEGRLSVRSTGQAEKLSNGRVAWVLIWNLRVPHLSRRVTGGAFDFRVFIENWMPPGPIRLRTSKPTATMRREISRNLSTGGARRRCTRTIR